MIASDTLFDSWGVKLSHALHEDIVKIEILMDIAMANWQPFLAFCICGAHWRHLANTPEPSCAAAMRPYVKLL